MLGKTHRLKLKDESPETELVVRHSLGESQELQIIDRRGVERLVELLGDFRLPVIELAVTGRTDQT